MGEVAEENVEEPPKKQARSLECAIPDKQSSDEKLDETVAKDYTSRDYYFDSYAHHGIHEEMLKDHVRTRAYQRAILENAHLFRDKIVLDVGCGTGILSMFAAQAGAKHVYAVECSSIVEYAKQIIHKNGYGDKITVIKGAIEEVELPYVPCLGGDADQEIKVSIIISEWLGYFLLYESMLKTVVFARDKWLEPGGIMLPDKAIMYICAAEDSKMKSERIDFWNNVYGFDMSVIRDVALREAIVDVMDAEAVCTNAVPIHKIDILTCTQEDMSFESNFTLHATRNDYVHALVVFFECAFTQIHKPIVLSTSPFAPYTHWKQTFFYLEDTLTICKGEKIDASLKCRPNTNNARDLDIDIKIQFQGNLSNMDWSSSYRMR